MATRTQPKPLRKAQPPLVTAYLFAYNTLCCLAWLYVLVTTVQFIVTGPHIAPPSATQNATSSLSATSQARAFFSGLGTRLFGFPPVHSNPVKPLVNVAAGGSKLSLWPEALAAYLGGSYAYKGLGPAVVWTQTPAVLEVVHAVTGLVKSSPVTVAMQVASRIWMVWGVVEQRPETHSHPLFTTMILAWSITEVIRYAFYACALVGLQPKFLLWLRYNTFSILYPLGAGSEAFLMASVLPPLRTLPAALKSLVKHQQKTGILDVIRRTLAGSGTVRGWGAYELWVAYLFVIWWPALYIMFTHMIVLRRKVFGKGKTLGDGSREKKRQ
ncbi:hypothetical protein NliqN6_5790 [Naganishia liquefaciens]|uniref:Very-long-chain (3R)-3-hydroxyacyl-CoA dehydratase n=1 Tax=Naganishia liquefaciens TaxID=104408 RepID=A0A8H3TYX8_9TREE|nr:hypothetical protein NliqN6_5790 [Naganishia liquefaciens]